MTTQYTFEGFLFGHSGPVTSIITGHSDKKEIEDPILVSGSRDKTLIMWNTTVKNEQTSVFGEAERSMTGHNHFVTDLDVTNDNVYVLSSSWDKTLRLWDLRYAKCTRKFVGQEKELESVCFSSDNCKIFSGGHGKQLALWNVKAQLKEKSGEEFNHRQWITKVRYSASQKNEYYATVGRDGRLKIWTGNLKCIASIRAHDNYINALALSLNGQYIVTGGKDCAVRVWDYNDLSKPFAEYKTESEVNALAFNRQYQLVAAATDKNVKIWDLNAKNSTPLATIEPNQVSTDSKKRVNIRCTSIAWSLNLTRLYVGCSDGNIRVYNIIVSA